MRTKTPLIWLLLTIMSSAAMAETFRGELTARYRDRWGSSAWEDEDIYTYLRLSFGGAESNGFGGAVSLRSNHDLLSADNEIDDGDDDVRVYYAYVDFHQLEQFDFRLGRQTLDEAEGFQLTGAKGVWSGASRGLRVGLFAGQPVSYVSSVDSDERAGGLTFSLRPDQQSQLRASWIHLEEKPLGGEKIDEDAVTLGYRRSFRQGNLWLTARTLDFEVFNEVLGGSWRFDRASLLLTGTYRRQEDTNVSSSRYFGGLSTIIGPSKPYQQLTLNLSRPIAELATVGLGFSQRALLDGDDENSSNQEFDRLWLDVFLMEKLLAGFEASANFSRWETDADESSTFGGSLGRRFGPHLRVEAGSTYAKYDLRRVFDTPDEIPTERFDVRTYYLRGDWRVRNKYRLRVDFDRTTDSTSDDAYYELELRFGLDLGFLGKAFSK
jgi:hypothetical protein